MVGVIGFEPIQPKHWIYSPAHLSHCGAPPLKNTKKTFSLNSKQNFHFPGASGGIRTPDPLITNQLLWPTELHWLKVFLNAYFRSFSKSDCKDNRFAFKFKPFFIFFSFSFLAAANIDEHLFFS